ncbi:MAG: flavodoxin domain-containing protein [Candidatus Ventricola sp.]
MKTGIVYYSKHHGNTLKLLEAIRAENPGITLIDAVAAGPIDLSGFDLVGFASGIYYSKFHKMVLRAAENLPEHARVFFIYTYGAERAGYTRAIAEAAQKRHAQVLGEYGCYGFNTFGPFKLIGGMAKGHPSAEELSGAAAFYRGLAAQYD